MKQIVLALAALIALAAPASAECYVDYKAKKDKPLRLHYGVAEVPCKGDAQADLAARLAANGWTLLAIVSSFDQSGLAERKDSAANYYLRF
ncbi:MAG: hypothetical protein U5N55_08390 [Cypionkella sp.]|nr:hypothetical protein [Cypionkella sp.]